MNTILITGSEGFVGHNLKEYYLFNSNFNVLTPSKEELDLIDFNNVKNYFKSNSIDYVIHSASTENINKNYATNVCELNLRMFSNLVESKKKSCILYSLCSGSAYSRNYWIPKMKEEYLGQFIPDDGHSYSKYLIDKISSQHENIVILRLFGIFGKYENYLYKFISNSIAKNLAKLNLKIQKNTIYDYLYIDDFCKISHLLINNNTNKGSYNITPSKSISLIEVCNIINNISSIRSEISILNNSLGREYTGDNSKLLSIIGNYNFISYEESIKSLYYYIKNNVLIDVNELAKDNFLNYAKIINKNE